MPTIYEYLSGAIIDSQQFSSTDFVHSPDLSQGFLVQPGIWFRFDFSPIMVRQVETRTGFLSFLTSACGIVGGVWAVAGVLDTLMHRCTSARKRA